MNVDESKREMLLAGVNPAKSAESGYWCPDVRSAPDWVKERLYEVRLAMSEKRAIPAPSAEWCRGAEKRYALAVATGRFVAPITRRRANTELQEVRRLSKETGLSFQDCHIALRCQRQTGKPAIDTLHRMRLVADEKRIARADELQRAENQRALLSDLSANATEQLKIQLDVKCGLRPASPGSLPYGFTDLRSDYGCGPSDAGFNGRPRMEGDGQTQDPTQSLRYADGETASSEKEHNRAATGHRCIAGRCSMNRGAKHLEAADRHQVAVSEPSPVNTAKAQEASRRANSFKEAWVS